MNGEPSGERVTRLFYRIFDFLFIAGPKTTGFGTLFGIVLQGLAKGFGPAIQSSGVIQYFDPDKMPWLVYAAFGILTANLTRWIANQINPPVPESVRAEFAIIETARRMGSMSPDEIKELCLKVVKKHLDEVPPPPEPPPVLPPAPAESKPARRNTRK